MQKLDGTRVTEVLGADRVSFLRSIGAALQESGSESFLIGGAVRDALLGLVSSDLDIMLDRALGETLRHLRAAWPQALPGYPSPVKLVEYPKFFTARLILAEELFPGVVTLDFSQARQESYPAPGAQPLVSAGELPADLARRDFSINAMAYALSPRRFGTLLDLHGGAADLEQRYVRVLHDQSFLDDPARLLRAVRFSVRCGFALEAHTAALFDAAVRGHALRTLPAFRLGDEFRKVLKEPMAAQILQRFSEVGLLAQLLPEVAWSAERTAVLDAAGRRVSAAGGDVWESRMQELVSGLSAAERESVLKRFGFGSSLRRRLMSDHRAGETSRAD